VTRSAFTTGDLHKQARRALIAKTYRQLNHELPIPFYRPLERDKVALWREWLNDPKVPRASRRNLGLYLHVPYCTQICSFCYLEKRLLDRSVTEFNATLAAEIEGYKDLFDGVPFRTLYLGGGTPGALGARQLDALFTRLKAAFHLDDLEEFSLETDLPSLTADKLRVYQAHGLTRLSVGLQNLDPSVLAQNNRVHAFDIAGKLALLEDYRFPSLNLDVIVGIPGSSTANVEQTIRAALALQPSRVSSTPSTPTRATPSTSATSEHGRGSGALGSSRSTWLGACSRGPSHPCPTAPIASSS
jgi:coproporphyrinogen III oxidase-like Fe-S oxidoreductase